MPQSFYTHVNQVHPYVQRQGGMLLDVTLIPHSYYVRYQAHSDRADAYVLRRPRP